MWTFGCYRCVSKQHQQTLNCPNIQARKKAATYGYKRGAKEQLKINLVSTYEITQTKLTTIS